MSSNRVSRAEAKTASAAITSRSTVIPPWIGVFVVVGGLLMTMGGVIALLKPSMLMSPHDEVTNGVKIYAGYVVARNLALGMFSAAAAGALRARRTLASMMVLVGMIQLFDGIMDCMEATMGHRSGSTSARDAVSVRGGAGVGECRSGITRGLDVAMSAFPELFSVLDGATANS